MDPYFKEPLLNLICLDQLYLLVLVIELRFFSQILKHFIIIIQIYYFLAHFNFLKLIGVHFIVLIALSILHRILIDLKYLEILNFKA